MQMPRWFVAGEQLTFVRDQTNGTNTPNPSGDDFVEIGPGSLPACHVAVRIEGCAAGCSRAKGRA